MSVLEIKDLKKSFGSKEVLRGLDLVIPENCIFGFVGANGSGKTTTMKSVLGLLPVDSGEIYVCGGKVRFGETETNRYVGYLPDVPEFYGFMSAREYLRLCGESMGMKKYDIEERCDELLSLVGVADEKSRIKGYSRGMKQRLGIAAALFGRPRLLICDEPTSALDPVGRKEILDILLSVKEHTTVLFSTHILTDVERICTHVALLHDGKIAMCGSVDELKKRKNHSGFTVEVSDAEMLCSAFADARVLDDGSVFFDRGDREMYAVIDHIREKGMTLHSLKKREATVESLFLEAVKK